MNKKMLLSLLLVPFAVQGDWKHLDVPAAVEVFAGGVASVAYTNAYMGMAVDAFAQTAAADVATQIDAKLLNGKSLVNVKGVKVSSTDVAKFTAAVVTSCVTDELKDLVRKDNNEKRKVVGARKKVRNAASHVATRLIVAGIVKGSELLAKVTGVGIDLDAATNEVVGEQVGRYVNQARKLVVNHIGYSVVKNCFDVVLKPAKKTRLTVGQ